MAKICQASCVIHLHHIVHVHRKVSVSLVVHSDVLKLVIPDKTDSYHSKNYQNCSSVCTSYRARLDMQSVLPGLSLQSQRGADTQQIACSC